MKMPILWLCLLLTTSLYAANPTELEAREAKLAAHLRCVVCQNQTVAESNAPLAADMRREIRTQLESGRSDQQVVEFFEQRYGAFVYYRPPFNPSTWLLWSAPFLFALCGVFLLFRVLRRRGREQHPAPLSEEQRARMQRLLDKNTKP